MLSFTGVDIIPVMPILLQKLTTALEGASKNTCTLHFNHCLFESIAFLIQSVCSKDPTHVVSFEGLLFPPFQAILQLDISEFTPYIFQPLAQLSELYHCSCVWIFASSTAYSCSIGMEREHSCTGLLAASTFRKGFRRCHPTGTAASNIGNISKGYCQPCKWGEWIWSSCHHNWTRSERKT